MSPTFVERSFPVKWLKNLFGASPPAAPREMSDSEVDGGGGGDGEGFAAIRFVCGPEAFWAELELPEKDLSREEVLHLADVIRLINGGGGATRRLIKDALDAAVAHGAKDVSPLLKVCSEDDPPAVTPTDWGGDG